jgi:hypothetical protein
MYTVDEGLITQIYNKIKISLYSLTNKLGIIADNVLINSYSEKASEMAKIAIKLDKGNLLDYEEINLIREFSRLKVELKQLNVDFFCGSFICNRTINKSYFSIKIIYR